MFSVTNSWTTIDGRKFNQQNCLNLLICWCQKMASMILNLKMLSLYIDKKLLQSSSYYYVWSYYVQWTLPSPLIFWCNNLRFTLYIHKKNKICNTKTLCFIICQLVIFYHFCPKDHKGHAATKPKWTFILPELQGPTIFVWHDICFFVWGYL